jgi:hypothetical protein
MAERNVPPGWPRMPIDEAIIVFARLRELSPEDAAEYVSTDVEGRRFYATAPTRVDKKQLDDLRSSVLALAERHGFPFARQRRSTPTFDQELAVLFTTATPMLPVEAADEEVWAFITLSVLPDVAVWRWPANPADPDLTLVEDVEEPKADSRVDRLLGRRRGVFRQAWWRGYLLGSEACLQLDEDNFINLTDRVSLTGYRAIGELITHAHLDRIDRATYDRRYTLRRALVLIGREFGRIAVEALPEEHLQRIIRTAFDQAELYTVKAISPIRDAESTIAPAEVAEADPETRAAAVSRFLGAAAAYASVLEPLLVPVDYTTAMAMLLQAEEHVRSLGGNQLAGRIYDDLSDLVGDWASLDDDERSIVFAALAYFVEDDDVAADGEPEGLLDDDDVVDSAFWALGRERHLS